MFSGLQRLIRMTGWVYRLYHHIKIKEKENYDARPFLSAKEINNAESSGLRSTNLCLEEINRNSKARTSFSNR